VVTHPENLEYKSFKPANGTTTADPFLVEPVKLRVYPYLENRTATGNDPSGESMDVIGRTTVFIPTNNLVGTNESSTKTKTDTLNSLNSFQIPNDSTTQEILKKAISVVQIDGSGTEDYTRAGSNMTGIFTFTKTVVNTTPLHIKANTIFRSNTNILFRTLDDLYIPPGTTSGTVRCSSVEFQTSGTNVTSSNTFSLDTTSPFAYNILNPITDTELSPTSTFSISLTSTVTASSMNSIGDTASTNNTADYSIEINPTFDRNGDGLKEKVPGILITLFNTPTKHPEKVTGSNRTGLPNNRLLFGEEYIPSPLGWDMPQKTVDMKSTWNGAASTLNATYPA
ncbi:MAG: hypothetical protein ACK4IX_18555, partial [Candidatus Sericytochromatia bacterium]